MAPRRAAGCDALSAPERGARFSSQVKRMRNGNMTRIVRLLVALTLAAALAGCVVAPLGPPRPYVAAAVVVPAPVVVFHGGYYWRH
jgi:hypothetical protein